MKNCHFMMSIFSVVTCCILDFVRRYNVVFAHQICCRNKQLHAIQSKELAGVFSTMANTRENLKETNEFSSMFSVLELNQISSRASPLSNNSLFGGQL